MRYIRTKDKIIDAKKQAKKYGMTLEEYFKAFPFTYSEKANNIEVLCDEIVAVPHNLEKPMLGRIEVPASGGIEYPMFLNQKTGWYHDLYSFVGVYGAIWTDKGLKYVAKLNKKGDFELL